MAENVIPCRSITPDLPKTLSVDFSTSVPAKGVCESIVLPRFRGEQKRFLAQKSCFCTHPFRDRKARSPPNFFSKVGRDEVVRIKVICDGWRSRKARVLGRNSFFRSTPISKIGHQEGTDRVWFAGLDAVRANTHERPAASRVSGRMG